MVKFIRITYSPFLVFTFQEGIPEEEEYESDNEPYVFVGSVDKGNKFSSHIGMEINPKIGSKSSSQKRSPVGSPKAPTPRNSSPKADSHSKDSSSMLRLVSSRAMDGKVFASGSCSPLHQDPSTSSGDSDNEIPVC